MTPHSNPTPYQIKRIYLKNASVEVPDMAGLPREALQPQIGVDMQTEAQPAWPGALECILRITLHGRLQGKNIFVLEVSEAGIFELKDVAADELTRFVRQVAASVLFPFARKDLASLAVAAGFQPILLDHIDFDALLTSVIRQQRASLQPAPALRLDVIAAKPAPVAAPPALTPALSQGEREFEEADLSQGEREQEVAALSQGEKEQEVADISQTEEAQEEAALAGSEEAPHSSSLSRWERVGVRASSPARAMALTLGLVAAIGLGWWYLEAGQPATPAMPATTSAATAAVASGLPTAPTAAPATPAAQASAPPTQAQALPTETRQALDDSAQRLAEQPASWFSIELGQWPAAAPLPALGKLALDRPLYLLKADDTHLRLLYGAFPTAEAAQAALAKALATPVPTPLTGTAKVVGLGGL